MLRTLTTRDMFLFLGLALYGMVLSPTPDDPGLTAFIVAILLVTGIGIKPVFDFLRLKSQHNVIVSTRFFTWVHFAYFYLLLSVFVGGVLYGNPLTQIIRDMIGLGFLCLPLVMAQRHDDLPDFNRFLIAACFAGFCFATRYIVQQIPALSYISNALGDTNLSYLANSPLVLLCALVSLHYAFYFYVRVTTIDRNLVLACLCLIISLVTVSVIVLTLQRAAVMMWLFYLFIQIVCGFYRHPWRMVVLAGCAGFITVSLPYLPFVLDVLRGAFWDKTIIYGNNMRVAEGRAVLDIVTGNGIVTALFGLGGGAVFQSPAVGGLWVPFSHNILTYYLLKAGIMGIFAVILYLCFVLQAYYRAARRDILLVAAMFGPIHLSMTLYTGFKSLGFGIIVALVIVFLMEKTARNHTQ